MNYILRSFFLILFILLTACQSTVRYGTRARIEEEIEKRKEKPKQVEEIDVEEPTENIIEFRNPEPDSGVLETVIGEASYYAHKFHGRLTANGETYNMYGLTAAHPKYPFDTLIRVTNLKNDKQLEIRINDRMPDHKHRIIDLSLGTAQELDMVRDGITQVKIEVLEWGEGKYRKQK